jgi:hypothetical protein
MTHLRQVARNLGFIDDPIPSIRCASVPDSMFFGFCESKVLTTGVILVEEPLSFAASSFVLY